MAEVVGVHGINQEQRGPNHPDWSRWVRNGIEVWDRTFRVPTFQLAFYGDLFLSEADGGELVLSGADGVSLESIASGLTAEDADFLTEAAEETASYLPERGEPLAFNAVPPLLQPVWGLLASRIDAGLVLKFVSELRQVKLYLDDDGLATEVRARVVEKITPETKVLLGHSLGSVVAYETAALHSSRIPTLVTVGSPLGMRTVVDRLRAKQLNIGAGADQLGVGAWTNIFDPADPVAGGAPLHRLWPAVQDWKVNNGNEPHSIERYLNKRISGQVIAQATSG